MEILIALLLGLMIGGALTYFVVRKYEIRIQRMKEQHQLALAQSRNRSIDGSRAVIKGKVAEQFAPMLPCFKYLPSDARFIGDPIDYIVFNGYSDLKDKGGSEQDLEVVILDIKTGRAALSDRQQAIARAIQAGRVRFEVVRPDLAERSQVKGDTPLLPPSLPPKTYMVKEVRKTNLRAYAGWTNLEEQRLRERYQQGASIEELAQEFQRKPGAIRSRLKRLGEKYR